MWCTVGVCGGVCWGKTVLTQWYCSGCHLYPSHWAPQCRSQQGWCFLNPSESRQPLDSWCTPSVWSLAAKALERERERNPQFGPHTCNIVSQTLKDFKVKSQTWNFTEINFCWTTRSLTRISEQLVWLSELKCLMPRQDWGVYYLSCTGPSRSLDWCLWCWWLSPTAHTERWAADLSPCSGSPSPLPWLLKRGEKPQF